jgi:two-component system, OmpR family, alkaline phosphatase synthesis response regulator PhoP
LKKKTILIADDEPDILDLLDYTLSKENYQVIKARDGAQAMEKALKHRPDIFILDIMMPEMDGIEVTRKLRANPVFDKSVIVILTARNEEYSEIAGFEAGADDYLAKPVKIRSLTRRLDALTRRTESSEPSAITLPPFVIDRSKFVVMKGEEKIQLPKKEFELLFLLASHTGKVVTRENILSKIWGSDVVVIDRTIDVHIRRLRKKIGEEYIETIKGVGYKFVVFAA